MRLSVDKINQVSPYWVIQLDELTFRFATDNGVVYRVGFYKDTVFLIDGSYHFFIDNVNHQPSPNDPNLLATVTAVIEEFFRQEPLVMLYICDPSDNRQGSRNRLYKRWFDNYVNHSKYRLYSESVAFENVDYYAGLIMRKDNPHCDEVIAAFHDIVGSLPEQMIGDK
ncbi:MAG: hypothetical protein IKS94_01780 [Prevotella sp.]|nr:hypothetical protein [Prevotella sp.]MBR6445155.1 hypothetical protein [Prevotella sp.]